MEFPFFLIAQQPSIKDAENDLHRSVIVGAILAFVLLVMILFFTIRGAIRSANKTDAKAAGKRK